MKKLLAVGVIALVGLGFAGCGGGLSPDQVAYNDGYTIGVKYGQPGVPNYDRYSLSVTPFMNPRDAKMAVGDPTAPGFSWIDGCLDGGAGTHDRLYPTS